MAPAEEVYYDQPQSAYEPNDEEYEDQNYDQSYETYEQYDDNGVHHQYGSDEQYDHQGQYYPDDGYEVQGNYEHASEYDQKYHHNKAMVHTIVTTKINFISTGMIVNLMNRTTKHNSIVLTTSSEDEKFGRKNGFTFSLWNRRL